MTNNEPNSLVPAEFRVDVGAIQCVSKDQQASELQSLELDVFDQFELEKGIIAQVEQAIGVGEKPTDALEEGELSPKEKSEDEIERKVRLGEATPFDGSETQPADTLASLQRYLQAQEKLQKSRQSRKREVTLPIVVKKKSKPPKEYKSSIEVVHSGKKENAGKKRRRNRVDGGSKPKRRRVSERLALQPEEIHNFEVNSSGSEYLPSESSISDDETEKRSSTKRKITSHRPSDDSDWLSSEDESSKRKKGNRELDDGDSDLFSKRVQNITEESETVTVLDDLKCPKSIWDRLYLYQKVAVKWFWELDQKNCGGILGDEMGLGKTIQLIAFLASLHISAVKDPETKYIGLGPTLIVCPTTVMHQWVREFHKWYPLMRVAILHDSGTYAGKKRSHLINSIHSHNYGILITSYNGLVQYKEKILDKRWHYIVLDEGHKIRNHSAQVTLVAKEINTPHRLILSGSPLQNNLRELWSLFDFIYPGKLGTLPVFMQTFQVPIVQGGYSNASQLQVTTAFKCATILKDTITPYLLRRMKCDVDSHINLPPKTEQVLLCKLTEEQRLLYKHYIDNVDVDSMVRGRAKIFVGLINLRKICNHPDLFSGGPDHDFKIKPNDDPERRFGFWQRAGKMIVIQTLLKIWNQQNHRVLLFTQGKKMLLILEDFLKSCGYKYLKLDGQTSIPSRQPLIDKFNKDTSYFVMLLTTKVGGLGVNLTGANRVVIYDPDWNPATDTQARERAWRIGQEKDVTVYRLITAGTIEEKIYHRQIFKQFLSNKVLKDPKQRRFFKSNDLFELFTLTETVKDGTNETAAIFAGTGSEVEIPRKPTARDSAVDPKVTFSESKIEQMRRLAQELSRKISDKLSKVDESPKKETDVYGPDGNLIVPGPSSPPQKSIVPDNNSKKKHKTRTKGLFEGNYVPHLIKCKKDKKKKDKSSERTLSQDDYVLHKLFSKSGIETALKHDTIMGGGPSDYAIVEAEADRVAKEAIKVLKESRSQVPQYRKPFFKTPSGSSSNQSLLSAIKHRNMIVSPSITEKNLLEKMIFWINAQGGTTSTEKIIQEFSSKLNPGESPLFKSLLSKVATFFRGPDYVGYWTIKEEFK